MRFYARWCDDLVFTPTPSSLPIESGKLRIVGHGIDTDVFRPSDGLAPPTGLIYVGRVSPIKRIDHVVRAIAACRTLHGKIYRLDIVGPGAPADVRALIDLADELGLGGAVRYLGPRRHAELPALLGRYRAAVNFSRTALDKSALEAMACELPVVTTNPSTLEALPPDLRTLLGAGNDDLESAGHAIHRVMTLDAEANAKVGAALRQLVVENHNLGRLFAKILDAIEEQQAVRGAATNTWK